MKKKVNIAELPITNFTWFSIHLQAFCVVLYLMTKKCPRSIKVSMKKVQANLILIWWWLISHNLYQISLKAKRDSPDKCAQSILKLPHTNTHDRVKMSFSICSWLIAVVVTFNARRWWWLLSTQLPRCKECITRYYRASRWWLDWVMNVHTSHLFSVTMSLK